MKIERPSQAGSMESNDILIMLHPSNQSIQIQLESKVKKQFGKHIEQAIKETLDEAGVTQVLVVAKDSGALDYTIKSRVLTALSRSMEGPSYE
ncbi:citrate lyase acyl carrier protein [Clostridia bacterium]|nr:citrate lyase acyl carrier protein [Clostridia bacterium]